MEDKKRTVYAVVVALVVVLGLLYSFGMNLFSKTPQLIVPEQSEVVTQEPSSGTLGEEAGIAVKIEPGTVQSVIERMSRYESYSRTVSVTYNWGGGDSEKAVSQVWEDGGWVRITTSLGSGLTECSIVSDSGIWIWYPDETGIDSLFHTDKSTDSTADLMQHLPTYEDVLKLDRANIIDAEYVEHGGQPCIYVEAEQQELGYLYRYWISMNSGLLMAAETEKSGIIVYRMESNEVISPLASDIDIFTLPDGTVLHQVD